MLEFMTHRIAGIWDDGEMAVECCGGITLLAQNINKCGLRYVCKRLHVHFGQAALRQVEDAMEQVTRKVQVAIMGGNLPKMNEKRRKVPVAHRAVSEQRQCTRPIS